MDPAISCVLNTAPSMPSNPFEDAPYPSPDNTTQPRVPADTRSPDPGNNQPQAPSAGPTTDPDQLAEAVCDAHADNLRRCMTAGYLYAMASKSFGAGLSTEAYVRYRDKLLEACGSPTDPIEVMLIDNAMLAFHCAGHLDMKSAFAGENHAASAAYASASARLRAELRRGALALAEYRDRQRSHAGTGVALPAVEPAAGKKKPKPQRAVRNGKAHHAEQDHNGETPEWLKKRFAYPIPSGSQQAIAIT